MVKCCINLSEHVRLSLPERYRYVHCWGGKGRTGTVIGCYLARHGHATGRNVIDMIKELRKDVKDHFLASPETNPQIDMVMSWGEGE